MTAQPVPLEVRILGPLEVRVDGRPVELGGAKQRTLLALLAVSSGGVVPTERIVDELWGEAPPASAAQSVQMHVSRLRRVLAASVNGNVIVTRPSGYGLAGDTTRIDARRFEELVAQGQASRRAGDVAGAREQLAAALELWRAEALTGVERGPVLATEAGRLDALFLSARLDRIECDLDLNRHDSVVAELEALVRRHPLQERIRALLMVALYRGGRQADALDVYRQTRRLLIEELGLEPTQRLQDLERSILRQDPSLAAPADTERSPLSAAIPSADRAPAEAWSSRRGLLVAGLALVALAIVGLAVVGLPRDERSLGHIDGDAVGVVDVASGRIVAQVQTGGRPVAIAATPGAVWVADGDRGLLVRVEPEQVRTVDTVPIGPGTTAVAAGAGAVWAVSSNTRTLAQVNVATNTVVRRIGLGNGARAVAVGAGSVWVANALDGTVSQIGLRAGRQLRRIPVGALPGSVAVGADAVWVANESDGTVTRIDPSRGRPVATVRVGNGPAAVVAGAGGVWIANADDGTVSRIDPRANAVTATTRVRRRPAALAIADGAVWVADAGAGALTRLDPRTAQVIGSHRVGAAPSALAAVGGQLWTAAQPSPDSHRGGTLAMAVGADRPALDPAVVDADDETFALLAVVADGLVGHRRADGVAGAALVPDLARALPEPADGGLTYRFQLRSGLRYSTGAPVKAGDVRASIERLHRMGAETASAFPLGLRGEERCSGRRCDLSAGITNDDATGAVTFHLRRPNPDFLLNLATPVYAVLPAGAPLRDLTASGLVGTGPYRVASRSRDQLVLERNPRFRAWSQEAQPDGYPDHIAWRFAPPPGQAAIPAADVVLDPGKNQIDRLTIEAPTRVRKQPLSFLVYAWLNTSVPPFANADARRAVAYALDRREFVQAVPYPFGVAVRATCQLLSPGFPGYEPYCPYAIRSQANDAAAAAPDLDRARRLVERSGTAGMRVSFWVFKDPYWRDVGRRFVRLLRRIGYDATLESRFDAEHHFQWTVDGRHGVQAGASAWVGALPSASGVIEPLLSCRAKDDPGSAPALNEAQFCDPALDASMRRAHTLEATETAAATRSWARIDRELVRRAPVVPILSAETAQVTSERLGNYQYHLRYGPLVAQAWVR
jgi:peptide/nickel transport system substrate-binding protein